VPKVTGNGMKERWNVGKMEQWQNKNTGDRSKPVNGDQLPVNSVLTHGLNRIQKAGDTMKSLIGDR
jgi:hypothetical protein